MLLIWLFWTGQSKANNEANDAKSSLKCYPKMMPKICLEKYHGIWPWREERFRRADFSRSLPQFPSTFHPDTKEVK